MRTVVVLMLVCFPTALSAGAQEVKVQKPQRAECRFGRRIRWWPFMKGRTTPARMIRNACFTIAGARNGGFSGQVVVSSKTPGKGVEAKIDALKLAGGSGLIAASAIQVRYGWMTGVNGTNRLGAGIKGIFDALGETPEPTGRRSQCG